MSWLDGLPACETCGAVCHGNLNCIDCNRWHKRYGAGPGDFFRTMIHIQRRMGQRGEVRTRRRVVHRLC